jgi:hypothetical protein
MKCRGKFEILFFSTIKYTLKIGEDNQLNPRLKQSVARKNGYDPFVLSPVRVHPLVQGWF